MNACKRQEYKTFEPPERFTGRLRLKAIKIQVTLFNPGDRKPKSKYQRPKSGIPRLQTQLSHANKLSGRPNERCRDTKHIKTAVHPSGPAHLSANSASEGPSRLAHSPPRPSRGAPWHVFTDFGDRWPSCFAGKRAKKGLTVQ